MLRKSKHSKWKLNSTRWTALAIHAENVGSGDVSFLLYLNDSLLEQTCVLTERNSLVLQVDAAELCDKTVHQPCGGYTEGILSEHIVFLSGNSSC